MIYMRYVDVVVVVDVVEDMEETARGCLFTNTAPSHMPFLILKRFTARHQVWLRSSSGIFNCMSDWSK